MQRSCWFAAAAMAAAPIAAHAASVTVDFSGGLMSALPTPLPAPFGGGAGASVSLSFTYDTDTPNLLGAAGPGMEDRVAIAREVFGFYKVTSYTLTINGVDATFDVADAFLTVGNFDPDLLSELDVDCDFDPIDYIGFSSKLVASDGSTGMFSMQLMDLEGDALASAALPTSIDVDDFDGPPGLSQPMFSAIFDEAFEIPDLEDYKPGDMECNPFEGLTLGDGGPGPGPGPGPVVPTPTAAAAGLAALASLTFRRNR